MVERYKKEEGKRLVYDSYNRLLKLWNVEKEEKDIQTTFGKTHIIIVGKKENPPLMLFHGVGDNSAIMWIYNVQELSKHFFIIAVDTIGGPGKSEPNQAYFKKINQSLWINEILDSMNIGKANIAGVSNGSYLASYFTIKNSNRVNKIVCMSGGVVSSPIRMIMAFMPEALFPNEESTKKLLRKLCAPNSDAFEKNDDIMLHWNYLLKYFNNMAMSYHKYSKLLSLEYSVLKDKALYLIGEYDKLAYFPKAIKALSDNGMYYKIVKNAGHGINHEQPEIINKEIINFISK